MPTLNITTERLLTGEAADLLTLQRKPYGSTLCVVLFGRRLIVDLISVGR